MSEPIEPPKDKEIRESMDEGITRYYQRKQDEVDATLDAMRAHLAEAPTPHEPCKECLRLEAKLERARYVGD